MTYSFHGIHVKQIDDSGRTVFLLPGSMEGEVSQHGMDAGIYWQKVFLQQTCL
jgi:lipid A disaccharide synthetase